VRGEAFKNWLDEKYPSGSGITRFSHAKRVEANYQDLDVLYEIDQLQGLLNELHYSGRDHSQGKPNPSKIAINGNIYNSLSSYSAAVRLYRDFRAGDSDAASEVAIELAGEAIRERKEGKQFEVERHLQSELRREISQLETGLEIIDGGLERSVESGFIDILARDDLGALVVIELKAGMAKRDAVGQIAGYMGDLMAEESDTQVRGILVAADFDKSCQSGVRTIPTLKLKRYRFAFTFEVA
jgi:endonuclease